MFVLQESKRTKKELPKAMYNCFYIPPELPAASKCHQVLIETLDKPERRLVLQIIDAKNCIVEDTSIGSFIPGFQLAWKLSMELNNHENERSVSCRLAKKLGTRFACKKEEEQ